MCDQLASRISSRGDTATAAAVSATRLFCVKTLIRYVLGADVFNDNESEDAGVWPKAATDAGQDTVPNRGSCWATSSTRRRWWSIRPCRRRRAVPERPPQPVPGLAVADARRRHSSAEDAYDRLRQEPDLQGPAQGRARRRERRHAPRVRRRRVARRTRTTTPRGRHRTRARLSPFDGYFTPRTGRGAVGVRPAGSAPEARALLVSDHQLFVDGSADGPRRLGGRRSANAHRQPATRTRKKAATEFHTIAIVGERRGGTHYFALDVTDAAKLPPRERRARLRSSSGSTRSPTIRSRSPSARPTPTSCRTVPPSARCASSRPAPRTPCLASGRPR